MLDDNKHDNGNYITIVFLSGLIVALSIGLVITIIDMKEQSEFVDSLDDMDCSELLTEIKGEHSMYKGYGYLDTFVEKECWK